MKRFGSAILDPHDVRAVAPVPATFGAAGPAGSPRTYLVLFLSGSVLSNDADSAIALMAYLVAPFPDNINNPPAPVPTQK